MRIFGNILPFIGFRRIAEQDRRELGLEPLVGRNSYWRSFEIEWLNVGMILYVQAVHR